MRGSSNLPCIHAPRPRRRCKRAGLGGPCCCTGGSHNSQSCSRNLSNNSSYSQMQLLAMCTNLDEDQPACASQSGGSQTKFRCVTTWMSLDGCAGCPDKVYVYSSLVSMHCGLCIAVSMYCVHVYAQAHTHTHADKSQRVLSQELRCKKPRSCWLTCYSPGMSQQSPTDRACRMSRQEKTHRCQLHRSCRMSRQETTRRC